MFELIAQQRLTQASSCCRLPLGDFPCLLQQRCSKMVTCIICNTRLLLSCGSNLGAEAAATAAGAAGRCTSLCCGCCLCRSCRCCCGWFNFGRGWLSSWSSCSCSILHGTGTQGPATNCTHSMSVSDQLKQHVRAWHAGLRSMLLLLCMPN